MEHLFGWTTIVLVLGAGPVLFFVGIRHSLSRRPVEEKYEQVGSGGLVGVFDAVWSPTAHEAGQERDRQTRRTAPAPSPGDPPGRIQHGRIIIDV
ncbi:hypothetical protein [Microbacterium sp. NPDC077486]|uniref:hypothetical protein n=1 Tax=Microbacterium sp. NPDC077486 TaxID=3154766 RepID=UPI00343A29A4